MSENLIRKAMNEYMAINGENHFIREIFKNDMQDPLEILNWYRNLYHNEDVDTERGFMARVINDLFANYKIESKAEKEYLTAQDVRRMSRKEVRENYQLIIDSMKFWH